MVVSSEAVQIVGFFFFSGRKVHFTKYTYPRSFMLASYVRWMLFAEQTTRQVFWRKREKKQVKIGVCIILAQRLLNRRVLGYIYNFSFRVNMMFPSFLHIRGVPVAFFNSPFSFVFWIWSDHHTWTGGNKADLQDYLYSNWFERYFS